MYKIRKDTTPQEELRYAVVDTIESLSSTDASLIVLDADLTIPSGTIKFQVKHPRMMFNMGIMEANMVGVAAGLSFVGFKPFVHTFASFATRKCLDQIFLTSAYAHNAITMLATDPGLCAQTNGGTHTILEDIGVFKSFPNIKVYDICDTVQAKWAVEDRVKHHSGFGYIRYPRRPLKAIYEDDSVFEYGKAPVLMRGTDIGIFASGIMLSIAMDVSQELQKYHINTKIIDCFSISKPDIQEIVETAEQCQHIFSLDNHNINTGLGSIVSNILTEYSPHKLYKFGTTAYGQVGSLKELLQKYHLDADSIVKRIMQIIV